MCTYASKKDIDSWAELGNSGWSFNDLAPSFKKFETFVPPSKDIAQFYHTAYIDKGLHDGNGPVKTTFTHNKRLTGEAWAKTWEKLGLKMTEDPQSGKGNGGYSSVAPSPVTVRFNT